MLTAVFAGCKENDIAYYAEAPRLELGHAETCTFDDKDYFNAYIADEKVPAKESEITVQLVGYLLEEPRTYCLKTSEAEESEFDAQVTLANPYTFPASAASATTTIAVACPSRECVSTRKTTRTGAVTLACDMQNDAHQFGAGRAENLTATLSVTLQIYPSKWAPDQWGPYSTSKYFFMMETFKATYDQIEPNQENQVEINRQYNAYKREHGPLYGDDEESQTEISFPLS